MLLIDALVGAVFRGRGSHWIYNTEYKQILRGEEMVVWGLEKKSSNSSKWLVREVRFLGTIL